MVPGPVPVDGVAGGSEGCPPPDRFDHKVHPVEQDPEECSGIEGLGVNTCTYACRHINLWGWHTHLGQIPDVVPNAHQESKA